MSGQLFCSRPGIRYLLAHGSQSPCLKLTENATGETIREALESANPSYSGQTPFVRHVKVFETDESAANGRSETIRHLAEPSSPVLSTMCTAHKTHSIASKAWDRHAEMHLALMKTLRLLQAPGSYKKLVEALVSCVENIEVLKQPLLPEAQGFRQAVIEMYTPKMRDKPHSASVLHVLAEQLFSGDWRKKRLQHVCMQGC